MCQSGRGILFVALQEIVWGEAYSGCRGRPCASPHARQGIHPQKGSVHIGPYGPSGWHRACPYTGGITHTEFRSPLFVKERRQGRCPATDSLEWRGFEILILRRTELFVLNEVQALIAVEGELGVIGDERDAIADGLRNDQMVAGVIVLLCLIDLQSGILLVMLLVEVEDSEITLGERFSRSFTYHT